MFAKLHIKFHFEKKIYKYFLQKRVILITETIKFVV